MTERSLKQRAKRYEREKPAEGSERVLAASVPCVQAWHKELQGTKYPSQKCLGTVSNQANIQVVLLCHSPRLWHKAMYAVLSPF